MANDRLTWQNVDAPDFSGAVQASAIASRLMSEGLGSFSSAIGGIRDRKMGDASAQALLAAQGITDPAEWDRIMAAQGMPGVTGGVDPRMLTPDAVAALGQMRTGLLANSGTMADTAQTITDTSNSVDENTRANSESAWASVNSENEDRDSDYNFGFKKYGDDRTIADNVKSDADKALKKEALDYIDRVSGESVDKDAVQTSITNDPKLSPEQRAAYLSELAVQAPIRFAPSAASTDQVSKLPSVVQTELGMGVYTQERMMKDATNDDLRNYTAAVAKYGNSGNAKDQLLAAMQTNNGVLDAPEGVDPTLVTATAGKISDTFDMLADEFPDVPDSVVAHVIENNIGSDTWLMIMNGDGLEPNVKAARAELAKYNDPQTLATLEGFRAGNEAEDKKLSVIKADLEKAKDRLGQAIDKGLPTAKLEAQILQIEERAAEVTGAPKLSNGLTPQSAKDALGISGSMGMGSGTVVGAGTGRIGAMPLDQANAERNAAMEASMANRSSGAPDWIRGIGSFLADGVREEEVISPDKIQEAIDRQLLLHR